MNILISVNEGYLDKAETMLFSLRQHTKEEIIVYLMNHSLSGELIREFEKFLNTKCSALLEIVDVSLTQMDQLPLADERFSIEMYYRLLAQFLLPKTLDRILWLDADIVVLKDISEFYYQSFDDRCYIVCPDRNNGKAWVEERKEALGLPKDVCYFNSGVMLMNLPLLRNTKQEEILRECEMLKEKLVYPDQDILNYLYFGKVKYNLWQTYNYQVVGETRLSDPDRIVILHYAGKEKPWNYWNINNTSKYYWKMCYLQGKKRELLRAYFCKIRELTIVYLRDMKDLFI